MLRSGPARAQALGTVEQAVQRPLAQRPSPLRRGIFGSAVFASGLLVYTLVQSAAVPVYSVETRWDAAIPLVPPFIFVYWMFFPFVVIAAFVARAEDFVRIVIGALLAAAVGWIAFLLFPASLSRPDPAALDPGVTQSLFALLHWIDDSHNTFPSLHVSTTWIALLAFRGKSYRWPAAVVAVMIVLSTLFVKQHTVLDVTGGTILAAFAIPVATALSARLCRTFPRLLEW